MAASFPSGEKTADSRASALEFSYWLPNESFQLSFAWMVD
jgi:hypothetical protein